MGKNPSKLNISIHEASQSGNLKILKNIISTSDNINTTDERGNTPLHLAATGEIARLLIEAGTELNAFNKKHETPLDAALGGRSNNICRSKNKNLKVMSVLEEAGAQGGFEIEFPFLNACLQGELKYVCDYLDNDPSLINSKDEYGFGPLHLAVRSKKFDVVKYLVERGVDVNLKDYEGFTPLHESIIEGQIELAEYLLSRYSDINVHSKVCNITPLYLAARDENSANLVRLLLDHGADINILTKEGESPLHHVYRPDSAELLLQSGCNVNQKENDGQTPLHVAATNGYHEVLSVFLKYGADITVKDKDGNTALHCTRHAKCIKLLYEAGTDINDRNNDGNTPLHAKIEYCTVDKLKTLLALGAEINLENNEGKTPLDVSIDQEYFNPKISELSRFLIEQGGKTQYRIYLPTPKGVTIVNDQEAMDYVLSQAKKEILKMCFRYLKHSEQTSVEPMLFSGRIIYVATAHKPVSQDALAIMLGAQLDIPYLSEPAFLKLVLKIDGTEINLQEAPVFEILKRKILDELNDLIEND